MGNRVKLVFAYICYFSCALAALLAPLAVGQAADQPPSITVAAAAAVNPVTTTQTAVSVTASDDGGEAALTYTWSATGPVLVTFDNNGTTAAKNSAAHFWSAGSYQLTVTVADAGGQTATSTVAVAVPQTPSGLVIGPATGAIVNPGAAKEFSAYCVDQFNGPILPRPPVTWSVVSGGGAIANGIFTAALPTGLSTIRVALSAQPAIHADAVARVNAPPTVATAAATPTSPLVGLAAPFSCLGADDVGEQDLVYHWTASGPGDAIFDQVVGTRGAQVAARFSAFGDYNVTCTIADYYGLTVASTVAVQLVRPPNQAPVITVAAATAANPVTTTQTGLTVTATDDGGANALTYTWSATGPVLVTFENNGTSLAQQSVAHFWSAGAYQLTVTVADAEGLSASSTVAVTVPQTPSGLVIGPVSGAIVNPGSTKEFSAYCVDQFNGPILPRPAVTWSVASGGGSIDDGIFTAALPTGLSTIRVALSAQPAIHADAVARVNAPPTIAQAVATPATTIVGFSAPFSCLGADDVGEQDLVYHWSVSGPSGATFIQPPGTRGAQVTAGFGAYGAFTVTCTVTDYYGLTAVSSLPVTVVQAQPQNTAPTITSLTAVRPTPTTIRLTAVANDDGGAAQLRYTWSLPPETTGVVLSGNGTTADNPVTATVPAAGDYAFTLVVTDAGNLTATSATTVSVARSTGAIVIAPADPVLNAGAERMFTAAVSDQFAQPWPAAAVTWTASGGTIASDGRFTAGAVGGPFSVTATAAGVAQSGALHINPAPLVGAISGAAQPVTGTSASLQTTFSDLDETLADATAALQVVWTISGGPGGSGGALSGTNPVTATFTAAGSYSVAATATDARGLVGSSATTVTVAATATSVVVTSQAVGTPAGARQFTAEVHDQFGASLVSQPTVAWSVSAGGSISADGLFTPDGSGTVGTVTAAVPGAGAGGASPSGSSPTDGGEGSAGQPPGTVQVVIRSGLTGDQHATVDGVDTWFTNLQSLGVGADIVLTRGTATGLSIAGPAAAADGAPGATLTLAVAEGVQQLVASVTVQLPDGSSTTITSQPITVLCDRTGPVLRWREPGSDTMPLGVGLDPAGAILLLNGMDAAKAQLARTTYGWRCWPRTGLVLQAGIASRAGLAQSIAPVVTVGTSTLGASYVPDPADAAKRVLRVDGFAGIPDAVTVDAQHLGLHGPGAQPLVATLRDRCGNALAVDQFLVWVKRTPSAARIGYVPWSRTAIPTGATGVGVVADGEAVQLDPVRLVATPADVVVVTQTVFGVEHIVTRLTPAGDFAGLSESGAALWALPWPVTASTSGPNLGQMVVKVRTTDAAGNTSELQTITAQRAWLDVPLPSGAGATLLGDTLNTELPGGHIDSPPTGPVGETHRSEYFDLLSYDDYAPEQAGGYPWSFPYAIYQPFERYRPYAPDPVAALTAVARELTADLREAPLDGTAFGIHLPGPSSAQLEQPVGLSNGDLQQRMYAHILQAQPLGLIAEPQPTQDELDETPPWEPYRWMDFGTATYQLSTFPQPNTYAVGMAPEPLSGGAQSKQLAFEEGGEEDVWEGRWYYPLTTSTVTTTTAPAAPELGTYRWDRLIGDAPLLDLPASWQTQRPTFAPESGATEGILSFASPGSVIGAASTTLTRDLPGGPVRAQWHAGARAQHAGFAVANVVKVVDDVLVAGGRQQVVIEAGFGVLPQPGGPLGWQLAADSFRLIDENARQAVATAFPGSVSLTGLAAWIDGLSATWAGELAALDAATPLPTNVQIQAVLLHARSLAAVGDAVLPLPQSLLADYDEAADSAPDPDHFASLFPRDDLAAAVAAAQTALDVAAAARSELQTAWTADGTWHPELAATVLRTCLAQVRARLAATRVAEDGRAQYADAITAEYAAIEQAKVDLETTMDTLLADEMTLFYAEVAAAEQGPLPEVLSDHSDQYIDLAVYPWADHGFFHFDVFEFMRTIDPQAWNGLVDQRRDLLLGEEYNLAQSWRYHLQTTFLGQLSSSSRAVADAYANRMRSASEPALDALITLRSLTPDLSNPANATRQRLVADLDIGSDAVGLYDVDVRAGAVVASAAERNTPAAAANGAHRITEGLQIVGFEMVTEGENGEAEPADYTTVKSDPRPTVALTITDKYIDGDGNASISVSAQVTDRLSETMPDAAKRVQSVTFSVNGVVKEIVNGLPSQGGAAQGGLFHPFGFKPVVNRTFNLGKIKPGSYTISAETSPNAAGNTGADSVSIPVMLKTKRETDTQSGSGAIAALVTRLDTSDSMSETVVNTLSFPITVGAQSSSVTLTETAAASHRFRGAIQGTVEGNAINIPIEVRVSGMVILNPDQVDAFQAAVTWAGSSDQGMTFATFVETGNATGIFQMNMVAGAQGAAPYKITHETVFGEPVAGQPSEAGNYEPYVFRAYGPLLNKPNHGGLTMQVGGEAKNLNPFTFSPEKFYIVQNDGDGHPVVYVITGETDQLPPGFKPNLLHVEAIGDTLVATIAGHDAEEFSNFEVAVLDENNIGTYDKKGNPVELTTMDNLLAVFQMVEGEKGMKLLQFYLDGGNTIELGNVFGDHDLDGWELLGGGDGHLVIQIEKDISPVAAMQYLWFRLEQSTAYMRGRLADEYASLEPGSQSADDALERIHTARNAALSEAGQITAAIANLYLGGLTSINVGADIVMTVSDTFEGNYFAAVGLVPFVGHGLASSYNLTKKIIIKSKAGKILREFSAEQAAVIRAAQAEPTLEGKVRILREAGDIIDKGLVDILIRGGAVCFTAETPVWTTSGARPIAELTIGDVVHAWDEERQCMVRAPIVQTYHTPTQQVYYVGFSDGSSVECTASHPFYVEEMGWVPASELDERMRLRTFNGSVLSVRGPPIPTRKADVYNIEVAGAHTYLVGSGVLVHNKCSSIGSRDTLKNAMDTAGLTVSNQVTTALRTGQRIEVHHAFPYSFADRFFKFGLNVNEAKYGVHIIGGRGKSRGLPGNTHTHWSKAYNDEWKSWLDGIERESSMRKISPAEFQRRAEQQAKTMAAKSKYDPFGNADTPQATGFLSLLHF